MAKILLAGATGSLGRPLLAELRRRGHWVRALVRRSSNTEGLEADEFHRGELTGPKSLEGCCKDIEWVFSCAGASLELDSSKDSRPYEEVDYKGNTNLLKEAMASGISRFGYVGVGCVDVLGHTAYVQAHEKFITELQASGLESVVIRPTGYFSVFDSMLAMAARGRGMVLGKGDARTNPIHPLDLAEICADALEKATPEIEVGGPDILTRRQCLALAFEVLGHSARIVTVKPWMFRIAALLVRRKNPRVYQLLRFALVVSTRDAVAPTVGTRRLEDYYRQRMGSLPRH